MKGKLLVIAILLAAAGATAGTIAYWRRTREGLARELENVASRPGAFIALLRSNRLWGQAKERAFDARAASPGKAYIKARGPDGDLYHVVRAAEPSGSGASRSIIYVFREDGRLAALFEDSEAHEVDAGGGERAAVLVTPAAATQEWISLRLPGRGMEEGLRIRGAFRLETAGGPVTPRAPPQGPTPAVKDGDSLPTIRYDPVAGRFHGPPGGPDQPWEVDPSRSPLWESRLALPGSGSR